MPRADTLPGNDPRYAYMSTFHWMPLLNGYSGYYPPSYLRRIEALRGMPDASSVARLGREGVRYVIIHTSAYPADRAMAVLAAASADPHLVQLGHFDDGDGEALVFRLR
jgi:hypothetical protein